jgi:DedD protein
MGQYFDEDELEAEERKPDTEITLGRGALVAIPLGILLLCGICFGLGFAMGGHGAPAASKSAQTGASDQQPLQASGAIPKPAATEQAPLPAAAPANPGTPAAPAAGENPAAVEPGSSPVAQANPPASMPANPNPAQPQVRQALPGYGTAGGPTAPNANVRAAFPTPALQIMVQVAAVKNAEDAGVLVTALRRRGYPVSEQREAGDGLIHVRVGPFASRDEASRWQTRLLNDGYNAIMQQ